MFLNSTDTKPFECPSLYHYTKPENIFKILKSQELWFSSFRNYHSPDKDPYENSYFMRIMKESGIYKKIQEEIKTYSFSTSFNFQENIYILSLTTKNQSTYHFSRFGEAIIEFDLNIFDPTINDNGFINFTFDSNNFELFCVEYLRKGTAKKNFFKLEQKTCELLNSLRNQESYGIPLTIEAIQCFAMNLSTHNIHSKRNIFANEAEWRVVVSSKLSICSEFETDLESFKNLENKYDPMVQDVSNFGRVKRIKLPTHIIKSILIPENIQQLDKEIKREIDSLSKELQINLIYYS